MTKDRASTFLRMIQKSRRGRLKIYLGYGAGVGKTYQMLQEGHRLKDAGVAVVVGLVETHGRAETAKLVEGLEIIPRLQQEYRGHILEETDVEAILARKPEVVLIDELAHTNVPGSPNPKRYQDVQDLLAAGIHVITTLNVQHLESLYDIVEKTVQVQVRERLPDSVLAEADEVVNVDLTPEDLHARLREGKIYPPERIETSLSNFFKISNLEKLRELTLRELASQIDLKMRESSEETGKDTTPGPDQVMVCLSSQGPNSEKLLRYASRLAGRLNRNWYAVYVQTPSEGPEIIDARAQRLLTGTLTLAKQLGAMVFTYKGEDVIDTILGFAREYRVGHIVLGYPGEVPYWKRVLGKKSTIEQLIAKSMGITMVLLDTRSREPQSATAALASSEAKRLASTAPRVGSSNMRLSGLLTTHRIIIWDQPESKDLVLKVLVEAVPKSIGAGDAEEILKAVLQREELGSTFFDEGVAFPHARIEGLPAPTVALGLTRQGVLDVVPGKLIEAVFLILSPAETPALQIQVLALVSRAAKNKQLMERLAAAGSPQEVLEAIRIWETLHPAPAAGPAHG
ncbi:MAG: PTS sugar transporter subunit IIA [Deltaproteobacteria bacterium]|nr:PTS sugar transporter subunit IIA [Deltaproteobacteria bacterium]